MKASELQATQRSIFGDKVKLLRKAGITPINIYGHDIESLSLQVDSPTLDKLLTKTGTTHLISLAINGENSPRNVIIKEVQRKGGTGKPIHVSFYQVRMKEKIRIEVPIQFTGESPAVKSRLAELLINLRAIEVECLPGNIPENIVVDISPLANPGDAINVKDLTAGKDITIVSDPEQMVVKVELIKVEEEKPAVVEAEAKVEEVAEAVKEEKEKPGEEEKQSIPGRK